jgi:uncharacterized protein YkwD
VTAMSAPTLRREVFRLAAFVLIATCLIGLAPRTAHADTAQDEYALYYMHNGHRTDAGLAWLDYDAAASNVARAWAQHMADTRVLAHNPNLVSQVNAQVTSAWTRLGENVGVGPSMQALDTAFMNSAPHRANILGDYNRMGVGSARDVSGQVWVSVIFIKGPSLGGTRPPTEPPPPPDGFPAWYLRDFNTSGMANIAFQYGDSTSEVPVACDWNGDGIDTPGTFRDGMWYLRNLNTDGSPTTIFAFGNKGDIPICGDWDGNGTDTIGIYRGGWFFLRNTNSTGPSNVVFQYGNIGDFPFVGDWNGDRVDTVGITRGDGYFFLRNKNTTGVGDISFQYGNIGDRPMGGDWNGDGIDTIGIQRGGYMYLRNSNTTGKADYTIQYGDIGDVGITGDWNGDRIATIGIVRFK